MSRSGHYDSRYKEKYLYDDINIGCRICKKPLQKGSFSRYGYNFYFCSGTSQGKKDRKHKRCTVSGKLIFDFLFHIQQKYAIDIENKSEIFEHIEIDEVQFIYSLRNKKEVLSTAFSDLPKISNNKGNYQRTPFGYKCLEGKIYEIYAPEADLIKEMIDLILLDKYSLKQIITLLRKKNHKFPCFGGGNSLKKSRFIKYVGYHNKGYFPELAIISKQDWQRVEALQSKRDLKNKRHSLGVLLKCFFCHKNLYTSDKKNNTVTLVCPNNVSHEVKIRVSDDAIRSFISRIINKFPEDKKNDSFFSIFKNMYFDGQQFSYELNKEYKNAVISNPFLDYLSEKRTLEDIIIHTGLSLSQVQEQLIDLELQGIIEETSGHYKAL